jgi:lipopolysaccharide/colanic/teichoic acid biosynthesis glycosyltransferase
LSEIKGNTRYPIGIIYHLNPKETGKSNLLDNLEDIIKKNNPTFLVIDTNDKSIEAMESYFYKLVQSGIRFIDLNNLYEDTFDRVRLSSFSPEWIIKNSIESSHLAYDSLKRITDITLALLISIVAFPLSLISALALKISSPGTLFISQERVGENNKLFSLIKFRSWLFDDKGDQELHKKNKLTRVGSFLRQTRLDELPQLINVLRGELSFIGPRPEILKIVKTYEREVSYYNTRHLIKPGLSGWAQINDYDVPRGVPDVEKTKRKLSYDLYYLKHRSFFLDLKITLRTIKTLLSRSGK